MNKSKKIIIIGGVAAGTSAAAKLRRMSEDTTITLYEKYKYISYATCGLPYYVSGKIQDLNKLLVSTVESFGNRFNVNVKNMHEVVKIIPEEKAVIVKNLKTAEEIKDDYDVLLITTGASVINLDIKGSGANNMIALKTIDDAVKLRRFIDRQVTPDALRIDGSKITSFKNISKELIKNSNEIRTNIVIVGGGFVGLEMLEAFLSKGLSVVILEKTNQLLPSFDREITDYVENYLKGQGIFVLKEEEISYFEKDNENNIKKVHTASSKHIETDMIFMGIGVKPENTVAKEAGIKIGEKGGIMVDDFMRTNVSSIYAAGDCVECTDMISENKKNFYLASIVSKQGRIAAHNIMADIIGKSDHISYSQKDNESKYKKYPGSVATSIIKITDIAVAKTGLSFKEAKKIYAGAVGKIETHFLSHAGYYPDASMIHMIVIYNKENGQILGFEATGKDGVDKKTDIVSMAVREKLNIADLAYFDFAYQPEFGAAKDSVNLIGMIGENLFDDEVEFINCEDLRYILNKDNVSGGYDNSDIENYTTGISKDDIFILDVRSNKEFEAGHIEGAGLIPINDLRENIDKLDKAKLTIVYCKTGYRAYLGYKILKNNGFGNVKCLNGSYLSWNREI